MFGDAYLAIITFMEQGGDVLWLIAALTFLMWTLIFERIWFFQSEHKTMVRQATERWEGRAERNSWSAHQVREAIISDASDRITGSLPIIQTCVALCPLFGLLGTVTGMIKVFEVMAVSGSGNVRAMAAGVSQATVPTMAGMVGALSGVLLVTILSRRAAHEVAFLEDSLTMDH